MNALQTIGALGSCVSLFLGLVIGATLQSGPVIGIALVLTLVFLLIFAAGRMTAGDDRPRR